MVSTAQGNVVWSSPELTSVDLLLMKVRLRCTSITSSLTPGALHAHYPWNLDPRRRTRVHAERGFLPVGRNGYINTHIAAPCRQRSPQAPGAVSAGHVSHRETGPAGVCGWRVGAHPEYKILSAPDGRGQAISLLRIAALRG